MATGQRAGAKIRQQASRAVRSVFVSYSHANVYERDQCLMYLKPMCERLGNGVPVWVDHQVLQAGTRWKPEIRAGLENADVYIVLMSQDYRASSFCMQDELAFILQKCQRGEAQVIGVALHRLNLLDFTVKLADGSSLSLEDLQCLPQGQMEVNGKLREGLKPINQWKDVRDAWSEVQVQMERALTACTPAATSRPPVQAAPPPQSFAVPQQLAEPPIGALALPYLCDRSQQAMDLWASLGEWHDQQCRRPLVILTEGRHVDCPTEWIERMARYEFANAVPPFESGELQFPQPQVYRWPGSVRNQADAARWLTMQWARGLGLKPVSPLAELQRRHAERMMPALWWTEVPAGLDPDSLGQTVAALAELLQQWPMLTPQTLLVVAINLICESDEAAAVSVEQLSALLQPAAERGELVLASLGTLPEVSRRDVTPWAADPQIKPHLPPGGDLQLLRERLERAVPMRRFVEEYTRWADGL